jgi:hypothetical protein
MPEKWAMSFVMRFWILALAVLFMAAMSVGVGVARLPAVGDEVSIQVLGPGYFESYSGTITDFDENMIALNCTHVGTERSMGATDGHSTSPFDICFGKGAITRLIWLV